jgi:hypothetical protein
LRPLVTDWRDVAEKARAAHFAPPASTFSAKIAKTLMYVNQTFSTLLPIVSPQAPGSSPPRAAASQAGPAI